MNVNRIKSIAAKAGLDYFLVALILMIVLAYLWPWPGVQQGPFSLKELANYGVSIIFFFYGLRLSPEKLKAGLSNWRLHLVVQLTTFIAFPLLVLALYSAFANAEHETLWLGVFYLAALPSTVSSSVVMVSIAGGNIPAAIFNASISSLVGVFITPIWMGLFLTTQSGSMNLTEVILKLILQVLVPVLLGIILNRKWGRFAEKHKKRLRYFDQSIILLIVYTSFCESFAKRMFEGYKFADLLILGLSMVALFFVMFGFVHILSRLFKFRAEDRITAIFCGSKKSLVHGTVMSKVLFPDANVVGIILLPVMIYHALQLLAASVIAQSIARKAGRNVSDE